VSNRARLGEQTGLAQAFWKRTPPAASASMFGVVAGFEPTP
jgi:hypothetical protein